MLLLIAMSSGILENLTAREGLTLDLYASELVVGDMIRFARGDRIPADARIISEVSLEIDESSLTGENEPSMKSSEVIHSYSAQASFADKKNIAFMGTLVRNGHGVAVVFSIGNATELGVIMKLVAEV